MRIIPHPSLTAPLSASQKAVRLRTIPHGRDARRE